MKDFSDIPITELAAIVANHLLQQAMAELQTELTRMLLSAM